MIQNVLMMAGAIGLLAAPMVATPAPSTTVQPAIMRTQAVTITIENGATSVAEHSRTVYRIVVRNESGVDYPAAFIAQMLPASLAFTHADPAPAKTTVNAPESANGSEVQWVRHLPPHSEITIDLAAAVGIKPEKGTLSTTACVLPDGMTRPLICDTDADAVGRQPMSPIWIILGVPSFAMGCVIALWFLTRRQRRPSSEQNRVLRVPMAPMSGPSAPNDDMVIPLVAHGSDETRAQR